MVSAAPALIRRPNDPWDTTRWPGWARGACVLAPIALMAAALIFAVPLFDTSSVSMRVLDEKAIHAGWRVVAERIDTTDEGTMATPGGNDTVILASPAIALSADTCESPLLRVGGPVVLTGLSCSLEWRRRGDTTRYRVSREFSCDDKAEHLDILFDDLAHEPGWVGRIESLTWTLHSHGYPVFLMSAGAPAARGGERAALLWRQWWWRDPIISHTINTVRAPHVAGRSPAVWMALIAAGAVSVVLAATVIQKKRLRPVLLIGVLMAVWMVNDARWAVGQRWQMAVDAQRFSDIDLPEMVDAALYPPAIVQAAWVARQALSPGAVYAVIGGNLAYGDRRLRYLLAPRYVQVNLDELHPRVELERAQFVVILDDTLARVDPEGGVLRAEGFPAWRVEKVHQSSNGLLIVRRIP